MRRFEQDSAVGVADGGGGRGVLAGFAAGLAAVAQAAAHVGNVWVGYKRIKDLSESSKADEQKGAALISLPAKINSNETEREQIR